VNINKRYERQFYVKHYECFECYITLCTRLQKERKAKEQLAEKHTNRSWEKELEGVEIYCQRQEKEEGTRRQPMFLMEQWTLYIYHLEGRIVASMTMIILDIRKIINFIRRCATVCNIGLTFLKRLNTKGTIESEILTA
jgi:hypothetical protein